MTKKGPPTRETRKTDRYIRFNLFSEVFFTASLVVSVGCLNLPSNRVVRKREPPKSVRFIRESMNQVLQISNQSLRTPHQDEPTKMSVQKEIMSNPICPRPAIQVSPPLSVSLSMSPCFNMYHKFHTIKYFKEAPVGSVYLSYRF
ncbi:hypothetical protein CIPAW_05G102900 [Carya illinoinensis]|uniref:Uncharacterized protein n=1 Tax=Carya illinoinensis TaxID=32201 RepID=A0A8T1QGV6_CARIL|nr:hypothetical protein CIPAW_05G102900 [Carya illinoinensis]